MGPAVRRTRPQSRITAAPVEDPNYSGPKVGISGACGPTSHSKPAGNGFFGCRDKAPKTITKKGECLQRPKSGKQVAGNPRRTALFGVDCGKGGLRRLDGGRTRARTWDPMIKSPGDHQVYQWHTRKPKRLRPFDFVCQLVSLQTARPVNSG